MRKCTNLRVLHACAWTVKNGYETFPDVLQHVAYLTLDVFCESGCFDCLARLPTVCNNLQYYCLSGLKEFGNFHFAEYTIQNLPHLHTIQIGDPVMAPGDCPSLDVLQIERPTLKVLFDPTDHSLM